MTRYLPVAPDTCSINGSRYAATTPAWQGLDFGDAIFRERSTAAVALCGDSAPHDPHLDVAWCHPDDGPGGACRYRVRARARIGARWPRCTGEIVRGIRFEKSVGVWWLVLEGDA